MYKYIGRRSELETGDWTGQKTPFQEEIESKKRRNTQTKIHHKITTYLVFAWRDSNATLMCLRSKEKKKEFISPIIIMTIMKPTCI